MTITLPVLFGYSISEFFKYDTKHHLRSPLKRLCLSIPTYFGFAISGFLFLGALYAPTTISSFELRSQDAPRSILLKYTGPRPLTDVELVISLRLVDGQRTEIKRFWGTWTTGESKTVPVEELTPIEKREFHGQALLEGSRTYLEAAFH